MVSTVPSGVILRIVWLPWSLKYLVPSSATTTDDGNAISTCSGSPSRAPASPAPAYHSIRPPTRSTRTTRWLCQEATHNTSGNVGSSEICAGCHQSDNDRVQPNQQLSTPGGPSPNQPDPLTVVTMPSVSIRRM